MASVSNKSESGGTFNDGCLFALLSAPGLTKSQLDDVGHRVSNLLLRQALNWPPAASVQAKGSVAFPKAPLEKKRTPYAQIRIQMAKDHDKIWDALERVDSEAPNFRVKKLFKELRELPAYAKKYPNFLQLKADLEANASLTALVESAWKLMGGGSMRSLYRWRGASRSPKQATELTRRSFRFTISRKIHKDKPVGNRKVISPAK